MQSYSNYFIYRGIKASRSKVTGIIVSVNPEKIANENQELKQNITLREKYTEIKKENIEIYKILKNAL